MKLYRGVVENNIHPDKNGQVKVRIFGIHTVNNENSNEDFNFIKTSDLPWAEVIGSNEFGLVSGIGFTSIPKQGTLVWVILDHDDPNHPIVLGTCNGKATEVSDYSKGGFCDPSGTYPLSTRLNEYDTNEISRGQIKNTVIKTKNDNLDSSDAYSEVAQGVSTYPMNHVFESQTGHMMEFDDSPGNERVQIIDKQGNYSEMKLNEYIDKAVANKINLVMGNLLEHIVGNTHIESDGNVLWNIGGNLTIDVTGNVIINGARIDLN